jgi:hypothetical protein
MKTIAILLALLSLCACVAEPEAIAFNGTATAACDTVVGINLWATASFPGMTVEDLRHVRAIGKTDDTLPYDPPISDAPAGFTDFIVAPVFLRDGQVAALCGSTSIPYFVSVTFALPKCGR